MRRLLLGAALAALLMGPAPARAEKVLRVVPQNDIVLLDPVFGTAWISMVGGVMIYESLFTWDAAMQPRPMMVSKWSTSPDGLAWRFTLRDGLAFHDGAPVTTTDVIASLKRSDKAPPLPPRYAASPPALRCLLLCDPLPLPPHIRA